MYQQRWRSKRLLRGYHGDWIPERRFRRWFLPTQLPSYAPVVQTKRGKQELAAAQDTPVPPVTSLFLREVERRLDVVVFRCCFAHSAYHSRSLVLHGKVRVNGVLVTDPGRLLNEGDLVAVEPESVPMLNKHVAKRVQKDRARLAPKAPEAEAAPAPQEASENAPVAAEEATEAAAGASADASDAPKEASKPVHKTKEADPLAPGVLPFNLPPFAAPFLFVPPYLEVSFRTCSAVYLRHPTLTTHLLRGRETQKGGTPPRAQRVYHSDIPTPYPAGGEMFGLAWEFYVRNAPRVRGEERRTKVEGRYGRSGFDSARAWEQDRRRVATRRGWGRKRKVTLPSALPQRSPTKRAP